MVPVLISLVITPRTPADRQKLAGALRVLAAEDDQLDVRPGTEPDGTVIGATTEAQLEEILDRLKREFEVEARVGRPTVAYLETLTRPAEGSAKHVRMAHGDGEYAHVSLRLHPAEPGSVYSFEDTTFGGAIPKRFMTSIDSGIRESMANGVLHGYPIVGVRVEVHDGSYHDTDSTDAAFRTAAAKAFQEAAKKAQPAVLEPVMQVVVRADTRHVKAIVEGLLMRRGEIQARTHDADQEVITAHVPLAELFGFEGQLRAETHGHASCAIRFACYQPVVHGFGGDDDRTARVGAPRRPTPNLRSNAASVPEPDDTDICEPPSER
jgi:elongation factor G